MEQHTWKQSMEQKKKITGEIRKYLEMNENEKYNIPKLIVHGKNGANREIFSNKHVKKKNPGMFPINNLILQFKNLEKEKNN